MPDEVAGAPPVPALDIPPLPPTAAPLMPAVAVPATGGEDVAAPPAPRVVPALGALPAAGDRPTAPPAEASASAPPPLAADARVPEAAWSPVVWLGAIAVEPAVLQARIGISNSVHVQRFAIRSDAIEIRDGWRRRCTESGFSFTPAIARRTEFF